MRSLVRLFAFIISTASLIGCSDWTGSRPTAPYTPVAGQYAPAAQPAPRMRAAVPAVAVDNPVGFAPDLDLQAAAADELFTLLNDSGRFDLTERQRMQNLLAEQHLTGMLQPGRLVHPAAVRGFDYVVLGHLTELSLQRETEPSQMSVAGLERTLNIGQGWSPKLIANAQIDLMIVDAHTGAVAVSTKGEFHHTAPPQQFGLQLTSDQLLNSPNVRLNPVDSHHILRLVVDEAIRPMLPRVDRWAATLPPAHDSLATEVPPGNPLDSHPYANPLAATQPAPRPVPPVLSATQICPECGARVTRDQEFCPNCGHKLR